MEESDFVADSDEDEQEMLETQDLTEDRQTCQGIEIDAAVESTHAQEQTMTRQKSLTFKEQKNAEDETVGEQLEVEVTDEEHESETDEKERVLDVGTLVDVDSRTWPGINKLGGAGRIVRVDEKELQDGDRHEVFYDVRYVLGGFERHIESKWVHSSELLSKQSNREIVGRDYYHDDFINKPHREAEKRRERRMTRVQQTDRGMLGQRKRKRVERVVDKSKQDQNEVEKNRQQVSESDEDMFVLLEEKNGLLERSSRPLTDKLKLVGRVDGPQSPLLKQFIRRRNRILESSDEESSDSSANHNASSDRPELVQRAGTGSHELLVKGKSAQGRFNGKPQRKKQKAKGRRYVGGYEKSGEDADAMFIQPEGDPAELPQDVIRETGLKLASTKKELMGQLEEIFAQQQKNMASFHDEQNMVNQQLKNLVEMSLADLRDLYTKICELRTFVTKTLVNAGEDAMNKIIDSLHVKHGKPPGALEHLECNIDVWQIKLNECSSWIKNAESAVESAFARRGEEIPQEDEAHAACLSESGESSFPMDEYDATTFSSETTNVGDLHSGYHELDLSYNYEHLRENNGTSKQLSGRSERTSKAKLRALKPPRTASAYYRKHVARNTTLDDYFPRQGCSNGLTSNVRLAGRQEKILPSDPRWNWLKMARKNLQRIGKTALPSPISFSDGIESARLIKRFTNMSSRNDSTSVQMQLMRLRDKRFRAQPSQHRSRESFLALRNSGSASKYVYPAGISFDNVDPAKSLRAAESISPTIHPDCSKQLPIDWETVFEVVSDSTIASIYKQDLAPISRQVQVTLSAFGHEICGPLTPHHLLFDDEYTFEDCDSIDDVVKRRVARLRQLANDLRLQESSYMDSLSRGEMEGEQEEGCAAALEWALLVSLEEAYHTAIASFAAQLLEVLDAASPIVVANHLQVILYEIAALIRQLPDCDSLFTGCKAYFFFFEVASTDAATTPFLTAVSRTYWYCLKLLVAIQSRCSRLIGSHAMIKKEIEHIFLTTLPVNRVTLAVVLFLFDLYIYLPSSHCLKDRDESLSGHLPALSLWMLVRSCCTSSIGLDQPQQESLATKEKHVWALLQAGYRQHYFDKLAWRFVRGESCGGYLQDYEPKTTDRSTIENCNEVLKSQLLALEVTWNLLAVLTRIYADNHDNEHEEAVLSSDGCDAKWAVVKDLLHPGKQDFLPFEVSDREWTSLQLRYRQFADVYKQHVLQRIALFSDMWLPCKEVIEIILRQLSDNDVVHHPDNIVELPQFLKQFITRCKELGNSRPSLATFATETSFDNPDSTTMLCKIIWIQLLKLEKRVHRSRFRRSVLSAIPDVPDNDDNSTSSIDARSVSAQQILLKRKSGMDWSWGSQQQTSANIQPADQPMAVSQRAPTSSEVEKKRMSTAVLLTFAIVGVCLECGDEQQFPIQRSDKDIRYMEREVDFYCKEILRRISRKPQCEVLASQALYTLGVLLLEKNSSEFPAVFWGLNDRLESSMKNLHASSCVFPKQSAENKVNAIKARDMDRRRRRFQSATMSSLYQLRDLIKKTLEIPLSGVKIGPAYGCAVEKCLEYVFSSGMEACLNGAVEKFVAVNDLKIAMEIFHLVLPRSPDKPKQCVSSEFDDFTDEALATFDLEGAIAGHNSPPIPAWAVHECQHKAIQLITRNLRVVLQQLVLNYPPSDVPAFDELYAIDLLGMIISTSGAQFFWSNVTSTSVKHRNLASQKVEPIENSVTAWLLGTLDVSSLNPAPIIFEVGDVPFSVRHATPSHATGANTAVIPSARLSDSWVMLTDGIIYQMLRKEPREFRNMDPHIWQILRGVASTCKFPTEVSTNEDGIHDVSKLYDLHLDVFQAFCRSAGSIWRLYSASSAINRDEKNQFRTKMVNQQLGIFVSFIEAFKINFRRACGEIDQINHNWHSFSELFLRQAGVDITNGRSYHEIDDTIKSFDERLTGLTTMFRFMYQCMDAFLFYCGDMAIGETNLFLDAMEILFRQVSSAEYPQALKRLEDQRLLGHRKRMRNVNDDLRQEFCPAAVRFVDSVQLFFARQKYPSLLHWFAQTSEIYQTYKNGWHRSPLRTLLMNILDPDGPLGIHSYYGISSDSLDMRIVRREAFYLSCGLFNCRCTRSFEHSRAKLSSSSCARLQHLRHFVLNDFMRETFVFARQQDVTSLLETMVPVCQFVRGVLSHANLNVHAQHANQGVECTGDSPSRLDFQLRELQPCLEWMVACLIKLVPGEEAVNDAISCVLVIELCGIVCEAVAFNEHEPMLELINLVELVVSYLQTIYVALSKKTTASIGALFTTSVWLPPSEKLQSYSFFSSAFRDIVVEEQMGRVPSRQMDSYGISMARAVTDLLAAIRRVAQQCQVSSDERLQSFTML
ncbi:unnamed protein product [Peronospora farinosa]|uniref:Chromo domain-containing protein n=1 Tax=Peronospora farinosa TaxID=134698 RepID=A0ABN8C0T7_9STRA|nr:unnamed protein product [Peronospora farinosa]